MTQDLLKPRHWATWSGVAIFWLISWLPLNARHALGRLIGKLAWRYNRKRRAIVLANLALAFPDWDGGKRERIGKKHFEMMGRGLIDSSLLWFGSRRRIESMLELKGWEHFEHAEAAGKSVIFHTAHWTGMEFSATAIGFFKTGYGVYNPLKNPVVDALVHRSRTRFGHRLIARLDGPRAMIRVLKKREFLYIVSDEDLGERNSEFAPFLGATKATLAIPARLAGMTHAVVLPMAPIYDERKKKYITRILPPIEGLGENGPAADARLLNQPLEQLVAETPEQYMWTLKLFKTQPNGENIYAKRG